MDSVPKFLPSCVVYQFPCGGCNASYISEIKCQLKTRIVKHLGKDKNLRIPKHLQESSHCRQVSNFDCFDVIDRNNSYFRLQLKEGIKITWKKPILNKQTKHFFLGYFILSFLTSFYLICFFSFTVAITFCFHS